MEQTTTVSASAHVAKRKTKACADCGAIVEQRNWIRMAILPDGKEICPKCFKKHERKLY